MKRSTGLLEVVFHEWGRQYNRYFYLMVISMFDNFAISVCGLRKEYIIGGLQEQYHTFRDAIADLKNGLFNELLLRIVLGAEGSGVCCEEREVI